MIDEHKYDDIINLEHHVSKVHKQMSLEKRSAQFAPFSALTGYEDEVKETARITDKKIEIDEGLKEMLNNKLLIIQSQIKSNPKFTFTYFIYDEKKQGGKYKTITGNVKKIDDYNKTIVLTNGMVIPIEEIINIFGETLNVNYDE